MRRRSFLRYVGAASAAGVTGLAGCGGGGGTTVTPGENGVGMTTNYFDPIGLYVDPGETVTWVLRNGRHSTTAYAKSNPVAGERRIPEEATAWNSETLTAQGTTFEHTFEVEGTYDYFCIPHKSLGMVGRVVVGDPGGPAEKSEIPDGSVPASSTIVERGPISHSDFRS